MKIHVIILLLFILGLYSCSPYKPDLAYPVVWVDTGDIKHARWSESVTTIILKDKNGDLQELYTQRGYYDKWTDSIYHNCKIGDTIN